MSSDRTVTLNAPTTILFDQTTAPYNKTFSSLTQSSINGSWQPVTLKDKGIQEIVYLPADLGPLTSTTSSVEGASAARTAAPTGGLPNMASPPTTKIEELSDKASSTGAQRPPTAAPASGGNSASGGNTIPRNNSASISPGAAAGVGIGSAIAGALIAAAILVLSFRRRKRPAPARSDVIPLNGFGSVEKTFASPDSISPFGMIERSLPQPAEDQALGGEMSRLKTAIKNHVQSFYHTNSVPGSVDQVALGLIAMGNMPLIASTLGSLLSNPVTRMTAVRFCITWTAVSRIDLNCEPSLSFLPPEIASCLLSISSTRDDPSTKPGFMSRWRTFTAVLLQDRYGSTTLTASDPRNQNISEALQALNAVLHPFADDQQRDDRERLQKLEEILKRSARFGFTLFSQPSLWEFEWNTPPNAGRGTLVISPALKQVTDENGRRVSPRVVEEQEVARGLESYL